MILIIEIDLSPDCIRIYVLIAYDCFSFVCDILENSMDSKHKILMSLIYTRDMRAIIKNKIHVNLDFRCMKIEEF